MDSGRRCLELLNLNRARCFPISRHPADSRQQCPAVSLQSLDLRALERRSMRMLLYDCTHESEFSLFSAALDGVPSEPRACKACTNRDKQTQSQPSPWRNSYQNSLITLSFGTHPGLLPDNGSTEICLGKNSLPVRAPFPAWARRVLPDPEKNAMDEYASKGPWQDSPIRTSNMIFGHTNFLPMMIFWGGGVQVFC